MFMISRQSTLHTFRMPSLQSTVVPGTAGRRLRLVFQFLAVMDTGRNCSHFRRHRSSTIREDSILTAYFAK